MADLYPNQLPAASGLTLADTVIVQQAGTPTVVEQTTIQGLMTTQYTGTSKPTPVNADKVGIWDSVTGFLQYVTWANLKATLWNTLQVLTLQGDQFQLSSDASKFRKGSCNVLSGDIYVLLGSTVNAQAMEYRSHGFPISASGVFGAADETAPLAIEIFTEDNKILYFYYAGGTIGVAPTPANFTQVASLNFATGTITATTFSGNATSAGTAGSFTITGTGFTVAPTATAKYRINGNTVFLTIPWGAMSGTSNATTFTLTGLPAAIQPASLKILGYVQGNDTALGFLFCIPSINAGVITLDKNAYGGAWVNSGTKALYTSEFTYTLD